MHLVRDVGCSLFLLTGSLAALDLSTEVNFIGGYRNDDLRRRNTKELIPPTVENVDTIKIKSIHIGQVGLNARFKSPQMDTCCDCSFLGNFYVDGFAYWGWGGKGAKLHEVIDEPFVGPVEFGRAELKDVNTYDYQIGVGYFFDLDCVGVGISGGYAWDRQRIKTSHGELASAPVTDFLDAPIYSAGYETTTTWEGPWIGAEFFFDVCEWTLGLGYEYHFAHYRARHTIPNNPFAEAEGLANIAKSSQGSGNVGFLNAFYHFCEGWQIGAEFKYQNWFADCARVKPLGGTFVDFGLPETTRIHATGQWISYSINFNIGYSF